MGMQQVIDYPEARVPGWPRIQQALAELGLTPPIRMIDGLPAFPEEVPEDSWQELRLGLEGGMITLRRDPVTLTVVTWGNAAETLKAEFATVIQACVRAGGGTVRPS